jgi:hypothetical protein
MTTVPTGGLFEYTRQPIFVSASVHIHEHLGMMLALLSNKYEDNP